MEHRQSSLDKENKRLRIPTERSSDGDASERLQKFRNSHLIGSGKNPHEVSNQQIDISETSSLRVDSQSVTHQDTKIPLSMI